jgi:acyl-CoA synthetase (AMP-forming)/AMP-acid ligase II
VFSDPFCLVYTSGSTAEPHGVMVSHANVAFTVSAIQQRLSYKAGDVIGLYLPLSFDYGLYQVLLALEAHASLYISAAELLPLSLIDSLDSERISVLPGIPLFFAALVQMLERNPRTLPHLRAVTNTGELLPAITIDRLRSLFPELDVFVMYGLTECKRVSILLPEELETHAGSVGRPLDGTIVEVVDKNGRPALDGTPGELVVRGPHVTMGYWRNPEETAQRFVTAADGTRMLFTGDIGRRSADGYIYFEGRRDVQAKHRGFRISLREIELAALEVSGTASAAAVASSKTDELHLFLTQQSSTLSESTVFRSLRERLEPYKIPDRIHLVASLPTTPHGKVDQQKLCAWAEELTR